MKVLFLHGWTSTPGGMKPTFLREHGHEVVNPALPDEDFDEAVRIAQAEFDEHHLDVVVGSSRAADPQLAIEAPRFRVFEETRMQIEDRVPVATRDELTARGHVLELVGDYSMLVGGGQCVMIDPDSDARLAGADPQRDGYAVAY